MEEVRVICTRPGAGSVISGVKFTEVEPGVRLSDEMTREQAEEFCELAGFVIDGEQSAAAQSVVEATKLPTEPVAEVKPAPAPTPAPKPPAPAKKAAKPTAVAPAPEKAPVLPADTDEAF